MNFSCPIQKFHSSDSCVDNSKSGYEIEQKRNNKKIKGLCKTSNEEKYYSNWIQQTGIIPISKN